MLKCETNLDAGGIRRVHLNKRNKTVGDMGNLQTKLVNQKRTPLSLWRLEHRRKIRNLPVGKRKTEKRVMRIVTKHDAFDHTGLLLLCPCSGPWENNMQE